MTETTAQLRVALETAFFEYRADQRQQTPAGDKMASAAEALLVHLRGQPSRRIKDYRLVFKYDGQTAARRPFDTLSSAVDQAVQIGRRGGRVQIFARDGSGNFQPVTERELRTRDFGYMIDGITYGAELRCGR